MKKLIYSMVTVSVLLSSQAESAQIKAWEPDTIYAINVEGLATSRNIYSYNSAGKYTEALYQQQENNIWVNSQKSTATYDGNNNVLIQLTEIWQNNTWVNSQKFEHTSYDGNNNALIALSAFWQNNTWVNAAKWTDAYDANNNIQTSVMEIWQNDTWANSMKSTYAYDGNNNMLSSLTAFWQNNTWENSSMTTYTYDSNNNKLTELTENWQNNIWVREIDRKNTYTYDDNNNNMLTKLTENWQNNTWVNYSWNSYTYDVNGNCNLAEYWSWDGSWKAASAFITFYYNNMQNSLMASGHRLTVSYKKVINSNRAENTELSKISIYPNPTTGILQIEDKEQDVEQISIFDLSGTKLLNTKHTTIDISHFPSGMYVVQIATKKSILTKKIVKYDN